MSPFFGDATGLDSFDVASAVSAVERFDFVVAELGAFRATDVLPIERSESVGSCGERPATDRIGAFVAGVVAIGASASSSRLNEPAAKRVFGEGDSTSSTVGCWVTLTDRSIGLPNLQPDETALVDTVKIAAAIHAPS